jgi:hypothetical protein
VGHYPGPCFSLHGVSATCVVCCRICHSTPATTFAITRVFELSCSRLLDRSFMFTDLALSGGYAVTLSKTVKDRSVVAKIRSMAYFGEFAHSSFYCPTTALLLHGSPHQFERIQLWIPPEIIAFECTLKLILTCQLPFYCTVHPLVRVLLGSSAMCILLKGNHTDTGVLLKLICSMQYSFAGVHN